MATEPARTVQRMEIVVKEQSAKMAFVVAYPIDGLRYSSIVHIVVRRNVNTGTTIRLRTVPKY